MKKFFKLASAFAIALAMSMGLSSCSSDDNNNDTTASTQETELRQILTQLVEHCIKDTYKALADSSALLADQLKAMRVSAATGSVTQDQVDKACELFKGARANYEKSEAFLLGAASQYNVDPHIDSWPLDVNALTQAMNNNTNIAEMDADGGDTYVYGQFGQNVLGFHGIEFILFNEGEPRDAGQFNGDAKDEVHSVLTCTGEQELIYAAAVAGDLRNNCYILECGWNPTSTESHTAYLIEIEYNYLMSNGSNFGEDFKTAGNAGSSYATVRAAINAILQGDNGARGICDEVADTKIGRPYSGTSDEDINYIESPYSYNSITDFYDNVVSIEDVWYGGMAGNRGSYSLSEYFAKYHPTEGAAVETAIINAKSEISKMPRPFVLNRTAAQNGVAIEALHTLSAALTTANTVLQAE